MILLDPQTREPLGPIDGSPPPIYPNASRWVIERDENGMPVRMRWVEWTPRKDDGEPVA